FALVTDEAMPFDPVAVTKAFATPGGGGAGVGREVLAAFQSHLASLTAVDPASIDAWIKQHAETKGLKMRDVAQPIRRGVPGTTGSSTLGEVIGVLGRDSALRRIERCLVSR